MDDNDSPDVSLASSSSSSFSSSTAPSSASSASSSSPSKRIRFNPSEDNPDVVYEWIHDDRSDEPLLPWRHDDVGKTRADGPGLFPARRLSNGEVQIQYFPKFWSPCWRLSLRRAARAPAATQLLLSPLPLALSSATSTYLFTTLVHVLIFAS
ncbi:hypothetical protein A4X03_0g8505 [Tilletia caries]|uniref:Uncharacterized protein n=1 Tax=Tilletia caries TaxID=13290 RepID=A0A8T8SI04_9BASI|nr:hypothetical protein A4X03_0g8505 [Tilletia caries]